ncbi:ABC transporter substrate-binding protein [Paenibacillus sp. NPDC058071]|uniref:ABC transporter substrate-binding protein n=1 Tax=Paenibacillus sp. NPDC058071 TaxID=3346326 RepID=UPI0036DE607C
MLPILSLLLAAMLVLQSCGKETADSTAAVVRQSAEPGKLRIGYSGNSALIGLKARGSLEQKLAAAPAGKEVAVEWRAFPDEASLFRAAEEGRVDIGAVGGAVPAFLHRDAAPLVYLAVEPANPAAYAIVTPLDSDIFELADLKGRRVAYAPFTNEHALLLTALETAGLKSSDVKGEQIVPADIYSSISARKADVWVVGEPELSRIEALGIRVVADGSIAPSQRDIYLTTPESLEGREELFALALDEISAYDDWVGEQFHDAAELLFLQTGILHAEWLASFERKPYGTAPLLEGIVKQEQAAANEIARLGGRKHAVDIGSFIR